VVGPLGFEPGTNGDVSHTTPFFSFRISSCYSNIISGQNEITTRGKDMSKKSYLASSPAHFLAALRSSVSR
jgi:hypothetical protein